MIKLPDNPNTKAKNTILNYFAPSSSSSIRPIAGSSVAVIAFNRQDASSAAYIDAVAKYNESLCYAESQANLGLAFANRSVRLIAEGAETDENMSPSRSNAGSSRDVVVSNSNAIELSSDEKSSELFDSDGNVTQSHSVPVDDKSSDSDPSTPVGCSTKVKAESDKVGTNAPTSLRSWQYVSDESRRGKEIQKKNIATPEISSAETSIATQLSTPSMDEYSLASVNNWSHNAPVANSTKIYNITPESTNSTNGSTIPSGEGPSAENPMQSADMEFLNHNSPDDGVDSLDFRKKFGK